MPGGVGDDPELGDQAGGDDEQQCRCDDAPARAANERKGCGGAQISPGEEKIAARQVAANEGEGNEGGRNEVEEEAGEHGGGARRGGEPGDVLLNRLHRPTAGRHGGEGEDEAARVPQAERAGDGECEDSDGGGASQCGP